VGGSSHAGGRRAYLTHSPTEQTTGRISLQRATYRLPALPAELQHPHPTAWRTTGVGVLNLRDRFGGLTVDSTGVLRCLPICDAWRRLNRTFLLRTQPVRAIPAAVGGSPR